MSFFDGVQPPTSKFFKCNLSPNCAFSDSIEIGVKLGIGHLGNCSKIHRALALFPLREQALLFQVLNALLSEGQEKALDGAPLHSGSQFHAIEQVFRHVTNIERAHVSGW